MHGDFLKLDQGWPTVPFPGVITTVDVVGVGVTSDGVVAPVFPASAVAAPPPGPAIIKPTINPVWRPFPHGSLSCRACTPRRSAFTSISNLPDLSPGRKPAATAPPLAINLASSI